MTDSNVRSPKRLTRGALFGEECRIRKTYGCSPLASKVWLAYARTVGRKCPPVAEMLDKAIALGRKPLENLHGDRARIRRFTFGERLVRESVAREQRGERFSMMQRQAG
jgi:hypothetical protein